MLSTWHSTTSPVRRASPMPRCGAAIRCRLPPRGRRRSNQPRMRNPHRLWRRYPGQGAWLLLLTCMIAGLASAATTKKVDLDTFDSLKKTVALPDGETLAYVSMGEPAGAPVVLIHGYTDNARDWVPLVPYLSPHLHLILVALRGHGRSAKPECCYTRFDFAYDVKRLLDSLGITRADLVGHSLGSVVAQTFAEFWPER